MWSTEKIQRIGSGDAEHGEESDFFGTGFFFALCVSPVSPYLLCVSVPPRL